MEALIIKSDDKKEMALLKELVKRMGLHSKSLSEEEMEDIGLGMLMREVDRSEYATRDQVMSILDAE